MLDRVAKMLKNAVLRPYSTYQHVHQHVHISKFTRKTSANFTSGFSPLLLPAVSSAVRLKLLSTLMNINFIKINYNNKCFLTKKFLTNKEKNGGSGQVGAVRISRYDWYQTDSHVVLNILVKKVKPENVRIDIVDRKLSCIAKLADESDFSLIIHLAHDVHSSQFKLKVLPSKVEVKLQKLENVRWSTLESSNVETEASHNLNVNLYPSSKAEKKDWDKIAFEIKKEEADEKVEGEAALNQLFQKIYSEGTDETRKAMNKSFMESGGTVLSTSWNDVGSKTVDVKPPDGVEWRKWD